MSVFVVQSPIRFSFPIDLGCRIMISLILAVRIEAARQQNRQLSPREDHHDPTVPWFHCTGWPVCDDAGRRLWRIERQEERC
jgi:hypothetical protein